MSADKGVRFEPVLGEPNSNSKVGIVTIYSDDDAWSPLVLQAEIELILERYGILDERLKRKVVRDARARLTHRAIRDVSRAMATHALGGGWRPPPSGFEPSLDTSLPVSASAQDRVLRWASLRSEFSLRDVQRAFDFFERAADVRSCLNGLVARGELEVLPLQRRANAGRLPSVRYRVIPFSIRPTPVQFTAGSLPTSAAKEAANYDV